MFRNRSFKLLPLLAALVSALCLIIALTACGHSHKFSDAWTQGETQHWYECECGEKLGAADHSFQRGVCVVCGKEDSSHIHDFDTPWVQGDTQHYRACSGCDATQGAGGHTYANGVCSVCGKADPSHIHDFDTPWVRGETQHYHKCTGCDETRDATDHTYVNGVCSICQAVHTHDFATTWTQGAARHYHACKGCDVIQDEEDHSYLNGECKCGKVHAHDFSTTWTRGSSQHYHACKGCDVIRDAEDHGYVDGICTTCQMEHAHNFKTTWTQGDDEHWYECTGCDVIQGAEAHSYPNGVCKCGKEHPHDFETLWSTSETKHYHACKGCGAIRDEEDHDYLNGVCTVCDYRHEHDYTNVWTQSSSQHWHACAGCDYVRDKAFHEYDNGVCTVCSKAHDHEYSDAWTRGDTQHWQICIGCDNTRGQENHDYMNGKCKVCGKSQPVGGGSYSFPDDVYFGSDVFVHDPAIFQDPKTGTYYAFGSHFAVASSADLVEWHQYTYDHQAEIYWDDWKTVLAQGYAHVGAGCESTWAPDLEYHDGKYYMYVSLSTFGSNRSAIVRVEADYVLGYYRNEQVIVTSNYGDNANCIDPEVFSDQEGGLWLVYGSFFGGIYIKELYNDGPNWGLPKESGFGTLLWKGEAPANAEDGGPEGPYVFYRGGYYYLMVSDGSLSSNYHMRVARATAPAGPYYDITGADMATAHGKGNKLAGNWRFDGEGGNAAYGHNSVLELNGEFFVVGHMRYEEGAGVSSYHSVRIHRLLFNEAGWPVLSPKRYAGEKLGSITESELVGDYDLILHDDGRSAQFVTSARYVLAANHTVTFGGTQCGTWSYKAEGNFVEITLNGVAYKGAAMPVWTADGGALAFSAVSDSGRSLWAKGVSGVRDPNLEIVYQVSGDAKDRAVPAFYTADGFTLSFRVSGVGNDWKAVVLDILGMRVTLPNLDTAFNTAGFPFTNCFPWGAGANQPGFDYDCFMNGNYYVTISISKTRGVHFYRDGVLTQEYERNDDIYRIGQELSLEKVEDFVDKIAELIAEKGFTFVPATFVTADSNETANTIANVSDLIVSRGPADAVKAKAIYTYYGQN